MKKTGEVQAVQRAMWAVRGSVQQASSVKCRLQGSTWREEGKRKGRGPSFSQKKKDLDNEFMRSIVTFSVSIS